MGIIQLMNRKKSNVSTPPSGVDTFLIVFNGESNSGGYANNIDATVYEKTARNSVKKLDEYTLLFNDLQVGTNNLQDHAGLTNNNSHGWELGLANNVEGGTFIGKSQIHLVKTGQGGSLISQWNVGGTYFNKLTDRYNSAVSILEGESKTFSPIIWYTQGINDAINFTNEVTWKASTIAHFEQLRLLIGADTPILFSEIMAGSLGENFNDSILAICAEVPNCYFISVTDATLRDTNHWNYAGMKLIADRMSAQTELLLNI